MKDKNENYNESLKNSIKGVLGFSLYFFMSYLVYLPISILKINYNELSIIYKQIYLISYNLFTMFIFFLLYRKELLKCVEDMKRNYKDYAKKYIKIWLIAIAIMYVSNLAIAILRKKITGEIGIASNEENIRQTLGLAPIYTFISASIYAPFVEELTFRQSLRNVFKTDWLFIFISGLVFGGLHVFRSGMNLIDLLYLVPYCTPGFAFAYILVKSKNILNTITIHFLHNTILIVLQIILLTRGLI